MTFRVGKNGRVYSDTDVFSSPRHLGRGRESATTQAREMISRVEKG